MSLKITIEDPMEPIHIKLGKNLKAIRQSRGLSLDKVAEQTGVSKTMLAQIERGDSNPTIAIMWKIANGLRLSFTSLIEDQKSFASVISMADIVPLLEEDGAFRSYPLFPFNPQKQFEIYKVEMDPGCIHESEPHSLGVEENIIVLQGALEVTLSGESFTVEQGNALRFLADQPHIYKNVSPLEAHYHVVIYYPS
jgi:transcriptional regulator with XRE-family HTH domain